MVRLVVSRLEHDAAHGSDSDASGEEDRGLRDIVVPSEGPVGCVELELRADGRPRSTRLKAVSRSRVVAIKNGQYGALESKRPRMLPSSSVSGGSSSV